jgi:hypothetical protein
LHRNAAAVHRSATVRRMVRKVRHSQAYPVVRRALGPDRLRRIRGRLVKDQGLPSADEALSSCDSDHIKLLGAMADRVGPFVAARLEEQDRAAGLAWSQFWPEGSGSAAK